ncbi:DUF1433 domain-containing protein [Bacillus haynesii]|uniref:DUF1433 domain-containing protein n=1 Tax=Bacillus haynesii TaxID=1925021 RepID=UPI00227D9CF2|nr:DUF1433 domain-containing protein [Bacillus haynesii]MCY8001430.1 DUF1433 domain-containing protein [Bacillus haynesii]MEC1531929.1 DUF1433 domain-containing protein [Bacillus haynesii]
MKKYLMIPSLIIIIIIVGSFILKNTQYHKEIKEFKTAKIHMEKFLKANYEGIESVQFENRYEIEPMGGLQVYGYYNKDQNNKFDGIYDQTNDKIMSHSVDAVMKKKCRDQDCEY